MNIEQLQQEHDIANSNYANAKLALLQNSEPPEEKWGILMTERLNTLIAELNGVTDEEIESHESYVEAVDCFVSFFDDIVLECVLATNRRKEIEEKIISKCKVALAKPTELKTRNTKDEHIVSSLVDSINNQSDPVVKRLLLLVSSLMHETNPLRLGLSYYEDFCVKEPDAADIIVLDYFKLEENIRIYLTMGRVKEANDALVQLFSMDYKTPEQYILMSLNTLFMNSPRDAERCLVLGLEKFPENKRLLQAKEDFATL
jgi:hypothetical protein